jgi:hypothetical protein
MVPIDGSGRGVSRVCRVFEFLSGAQPSAPFLRSHDPFEDELMNIVLKSALVGAALIVAHACATPVEIVDDVLPSDPSDFGDGGLPLAGTGGGAGAAQGGTGGSGVPAGGTGTGIGGASAGTGMQASAGSGGLPVGTGGTGAGLGGATAQGGAGGAPGGAGGAAAGTGGAAAGTGGAAAGTGGAAGTGPTSTFDATQCDFEDPAGCEALTCQAVCPTNDGGSCLTRCNTVITCVSGEEATNPGASCITEADPLCGARVQGQAKACTTAVEPAGGANPAAPTGTGNPQPSFVARRFVECICSVPRP